MIDEIEETMEGDFGILIKKHSNVGKEEEKINEKNKIANMKEMVQNGMKDLMNRVSILSELIRNKDRISQFSLEETREGSESYLEEVTTSSVADLSNAAESDNDIIFGHRFEDAGVIEESLKKAKVQKTQQFLWQAKKILKMQKLR